MQERTYNERLNEGFSILHFGEQPEPQAVTLRDMANSLDKPFDTGCLEESSPPLVIDSLKSN